MTETTTETQLWAYRMPGPHEARHIMPFERFDRRVRCPGCGCLKSGDRDIPNLIQESCDAPHCPCHVDVLDVARLRGSVALEGDS